MLRFTLKRITVLTLIAGTCALWASSAAHAQNLVAYDDEFYVPLGQPLAIDPFGVLDNDILDDEAAGELGATAATEVRLEIYDQRGRLVRRLTRTHLDAGRHAVDWDGRDHAGRAVASSTYFGLLTVSGGGMRETHVRKILVRR